MKTINNLSDLKKFGIDILTGESCALSRRLLCDVTEDGKNLILEALGLPDISMPADWNGGNAIGSILLDRETLATISIIALFKDKETIEVWEREGRFEAIDQETLSLYQVADPALTDGIRKYRLPNRGIGLRNTHQMSGRSA